MKHTSFLLLHILPLLALPALAENAPEMKPPAASAPAFQKLEQLATKQMQTGVTSKSSLLKARILEARALFANGEFSRDQWLAKEQKLNVELLQWQTHNVSGNPAAQTERYRYLRYEDGSEELYDHQNDPHEWENLSTRSEYAALKKKLQAQILSFQRE